MVIEYFLEWITTAPVQKRIEAAGAMVRAYLNDEIDDEERDDVEAAITVLTTDPSPLVRAELAHAFGARHNAPRHIMSALASDVVEVTIIALSRSSVFHDGELVNFIKSGDFEKQLAISCRPWLSGEVIGAISEYACEEACLGVLANPAAQFAGHHYHKIAERFGGSAEIRDLLLNKEDLPVKTKMLLTMKLGDKLSAFVSGNNWLVSAHAEKVRKEAYDKIAIELSMDVTDEELNEIVREFIAEERITVAFLLRAVCMGNIALVACVFSALSGVSFSRVETALAKGRNSAFRAIYCRAGLPVSAFNIFSCAVAKWRELLSSNVDIDQSRMPFLVTRDVLRDYEQGLDPVVDELVVMLRRLSAEAAHENAKSKVTEIAQRAPDAVKQISRYMAAKDQETQIPKLENDHQKQKQIPLIKSPDILELNAVKTEIHPSYVPSIETPEADTRPDMSIEPDMVARSSENKTEPSDAINEWHVFDLDTEEELSAEDALVYCAGTQAA